MFTANRIGIPNKSPIAFFFHEVGYASTKEKNSIEIKMAEHSVITLTLKLSAETNTP